MPDADADGDGNRNRVEKLNSSGAATKLYWYSGGNVLDETGNQGNMVSSDPNFNEYVFFGGKRIARRNSGTVYYYVEDHLGTSREIVQAGQTSTCYDADFYPYGGEMTVTDTCDSAYKFTGKERDSLAENGSLDDFEARYYNSSMGRFMSPDEFPGGPADVFDPAADPPSPLPYAMITNPQSLNKYTYTYNNPLRYIDPNGHDVKDYLLLTFGTNNVPNTPHPEIADVKTLGPKLTSNGIYLALNTQATFDEGDNPADYKPLRDAYILQNEGNVLQRRTGSEENPSKNQIANTGNSQFVFDSPGVSVNGIPRAELNGKLDIAFSLSEKNTKTGQVSKNEFFYRVTLIVKNGEIVGYRATPISQQEFHRITTNEEKEKKKKEKRECE